MAKRRGPWQVHGHDVAFENPWMRVLSHEVTLPNGTPGRYGVVTFRMKALAILPIHEDGTITLVGQHRFPTDRYGWEIPEGGGDLDGDPQVCAARELREETGLSAGHWREILRLDMSNSITTETAVGFIATDLTAGEPDPDETEVLETRRIPFRQALDEAMSGTIHDALTVAMLMKAYYMAREGELDATLAALILKR